jgi:hypothetical protein
VALSGCCVVAPIGSKYAAKGNWLVLPTLKRLDGASSVLPQQVAVLALQFMEKLRFGLCPPSADNHAAARRPRAPYFALADTNSGRSHLRVSRSEEVAA